jgi:hypothetical protein
LIGFLSAATRQSQRLKDASSSVPAPVPTDLKRKSGHVDKISSKKIKLKKTRQAAQTKPPALIQSALYAAERLSHAVYISHTINLVIISELFYGRPSHIVLNIAIDDLAYVWWYDNDGAIQSHGLNFVQELPHFLVLLLCFQRFTPRNWGIIPELRTTEQSPLSFPSSPISIVMDHTDPIRNHFGIVGRATHTLSAKVHRKQPRDVGTRNQEDRDLVVKVYWPEASRVAEEEIIKEARRIGEGNDAVKGHLPDLIHSQDLAEYSTDRIRRAFGISVGNHRVLRIILFRRLYPITDLTGDKFWKAFWECFSCKCTLKPLLHVTS